MNARDFFTRYGGWLLAGFSSIGVVTTSVLVADETPKAQAALSVKRQEKGEDLTLRKPKIALLVVSKFVRKILLRLNIRKSGVRV